MDTELFSMRGQAAVVTGASSNIGAAIARGYAEAGADLLLVARGEERLRAVGERLRSDTGRQVETLAVDVAEPSAAEEIFACAEQRLRPVDVLVNNAYSVGEVASIFQADDRAWEQSLATNVMGPMRLCRVFGGRMRSGSGGSIVNLLSPAGFLPAPPNLSAYGAAKAALWMMTRYLAIEGAPSVRANAICPGLITETGEPRNESQRLVLPTVPMRRPGRPEEVVGAAIYLASAASSFTTGTVIVVNGGTHW
jgi:NAD(P)-dependent dehydrogenase (short-subunit alcohol dehydrogenase family)